MNGDHKVLTAGKWAGAIAGILALLMTIWGSVSRLSSLVEAVDEHTEAMAELREENQRIEREARENLETVLEAVRARAERDQEIIIQLRIAVAALEADRGDSERGGSSTSTAATRIRIPAGSHRAEARGALERAGELSAVADPLENVGGL